MRGDLNKIIEEVNKVLKTAFDRIETLNARIEAIEDLNKPKKRGRPKKTDVEADLIKKK